MTSFASQPRPTSLWPARASRWQLRSKTLEFSTRPLIMGILNVTPDSFSDGGKFSTTELAVARGIAMVDEGADLLDVGGESTRPYADPVSTEEELRRVVPVLEQLVARVPVPVSIDTSKSEVACQALEIGVEVVNDVTGLEGDPEMMDVVRSSGAGICVMHMQGTPQTMQDNPSYGDVVVEIFDYLRERRDALVSGNIAQERICLDPGIGFGKSHQHNIDLLAKCQKFHELGCPLLIGHSRKGFIGKILGDSESTRLFGSIGVALALARHGIQVIRVHDVAAVSQALTLFEYSGGIDDCPRTVAQE